MKQEIVGKLWLITTSHVSESEAIIYLAMAVSMFEIEVGWCNVKSAVTVSSWRSGCCLSFCVSYC